MITKLIAAVALSGVSLWAAAHADATTADDAFIATLSDYGIYNHQGDKALIAIGHEICSEIDSGIAPSTITRNFNKLNSEVDWAYVAGAAVGAYCPWDTDVNYDGSRSRLGV
jgi:hypothetical protein